jgi:tetratricopeptide (TPR) repeat protein
VVVFLATAISAGAASPYGYAAFSGLLEIGAFLGVCLLAARSGRIASWLGLPLLVAAAAEGVVALVQRLAGGQARPAGTLLNPNHLGAWLVAVVLLNAGQTPRRHRWRWLVLLLVAAGGAWLTGSRGALVALVAGASYLAARRWGELSPPSRAAAVGVALVALVAVGWRIGARLGEPDPYRYHRLQIWHASVRALLEAPLTGTGPRQFGVAAQNLNFPDGAGPLRYDRSFTSTHSDLLRPFCELGWPGGLAAVGAAAIAARELARRRRDGRLGARDDGALAALMGLAAQALVDNLSERPAVYLLAGAVLGSLLSSRPETAPPVAAGVSRSLRVVVASCLLALFMAGDVGPYLAHRWFRALSRSRVDADGQRRLERVLRLNPLQPDYWLRRARERAGDGSAWALADYAAAREAAERAVRLSPADARYRAGLAWIEGLATRTLFRDRASRERTALRYREAEERSRYDPLVPIELAKFLLDTGDPAGARRAAERALAIEPNAVPARLLLADAILRAAPGPQASVHAARLLEEARGLAKRWQGHRGEGRYAEELLGLDRAAFDRIARKAVQGGAASVGS